MLFLSVFPQSYIQKEKEFYNYLRNKEYVLAKNKAIETLTWAKQNYGDTSINIALGYRLLGDAYYSDNIDSSLYFYSQSMSLLQKQKRQRIFLAAKILYNSANLYAQKKDYDSYFLNLNESAKIIRELKYPEFPFSEVVMEQLYHFQLVNKEYIMADSLLIECVFIFNKYSKQNTEQCASVLQSLGTYYFTQEKYSEAKKYILASIESYKNSIGEDNLFCSGNYLWLGEIYDRNEDYIFAEKCYLKSLDIYKRILPKLDEKEKKLYYYSTLEAFAQFYWGLGLYDKSLNVYNQVRSIYVNNNDTSRIISLVVPMSISFIDNKDFELANIYLLDQVKYFPKISKDNIKDYLPVLRSLILSYSVLDSIQKREGFVNQQLMLSKKFIGDKSEEYLNALHDQCSFLIDKNEINKATKVVDDCISLSKEIYKDDLKKLTETLPRYAGYYSEIGNDNKSIELYQEYFSNSKILNLPVDKVYNYYLNDYSNVLQKFGEFPLAYDIIEKLFLSKRNFIINNIFYLNENERERIWNKEQIYFNQTINFTSKAYLRVNASLELAYNSILITKSLLMESSRDFSKVINVSKDSTLLNNYQELLMLRNYIAKFSSEDSESQELLNQLKLQADSIDQVLSRKMSAYADYKKNFALSWKDVQSNLGNEEASIEFAKYYDDNDTSYNYMALIVKPGDKYPQLVKLCSEDNLKQFSSENELGEIYSLIWKPISEKLDGIKTIYYTPEGLLNNIPFQALYQEKDGMREYLMDKYSMNQLTSTRYLALGLKQKEQETIEPSIALFGGINYKDFPNVKTDTSNHDQSAEAAFLYKNAVVLNRDLDSSRAGASYLPGTKKEVEAIADVLKLNKWQVDVSEGKNATENKIKSLSGNNSKSILHIATHGFAFPDKEEKRQNQGARMMHGNDLYKASDNPMIRSGLLFGGANMTWQGNGDSLLKTTNEDGVLTAYELSQMDLSNTKLAVLSACETGKGAIQGSEGTFGLKRALKLAGVDNMIVSLWKVPDDATMEMMTLFYTELAKTKKPVSSFEYAQKSMRYKYPNDPKSWAGFVFVR